MKYIDLFCGIGGFRQAAINVGRKHGKKLRCVFSSDIDPDAQKAYRANYGDMPHGDITLISSDEIPPHDLLFAGFPCQPFSIIGGMRGFADTRGTLFYEIARIIRHHRPKAIVLENVKQLVGHDRGRTLETIVRVLQQDLGYHVDYTVLNALDFGLPQKRERVVIVGFRDSKPFHRFAFPVGGIPMKPLSRLLQPDAEISDFYRASPHIRRARAKWHKPDKSPTIWHENKAGNISKYPYSCALRAGASYNYLLVDGKRRLTEREMLRLQGFPDSFQIVCGYSATRKQAGNAVPVPVVEAVLDNVLAALNPKSDVVRFDGDQGRFAFERARSYGRS